MKTFDVLGVRMSALTLPLATEAILAAAREKRPGYVCVTGVHGIMEAQRDPALREILNAAFLNTTDGMPLVWLGRRAVGPWVDRVYGPDLMLEVFAAALATGGTHFLYGGAPGVAEKLKSRLEERFPGTRIVGTFCPPFRPLEAGEETALAAQVAAVQPAFFWVGLSTPKQEKFMRAYLPKLQTTVMLGVGAAFDFHAGTMRQAPRWMQRSGLEWLFRLGMEPRRLWRRYLVNNPLFVWKLLRRSRRL
ncbi:MAG TPA: WecB/TagA/CpsF family glycosyltransferase [Chthoniobacteraceae bacterium]|nr:WecB/TagA/CpsF family glycosyltransferase [Chthoniobacteraceae bacterium]